MPAVLHGCPAMMRLIRARAASRNWQGEADMTPPTKPPQAILSELINAYWKTFSIVAAAELGIADLIGDEPQAVSTLAEKSATHPPSLYRLLRALASLGIFVEDDAGRFANTPLSATLRSGASGSLRGLARLSGRMHLRAW